MSATEQGLSSQQARRLAAILQEIERLAWPMSGSAASRIINLAIKGRTITG